MKELSKNERIITTIVVDGKKQNLTEFSFETNSDGMVVDATVGVDGKISETGSKTVPRAGSAKQLKL